MNDPAYRQDYDGLAAEYDLAVALIRVRADAGLTRAELDARVGAKQ